MNNVHLFKLVKTMQHLSSNLTQISLSVKRGCLFEPSIEINIKKFKDDNEVQTKSEWMDHCRHLIPIGYITLNLDPSKQFSFIKGSVSIASFVFAYFNCDLTSLFYIDAFYNLSKGTSINHPYDLESVTKLLSSLYFVKTSPIRYLFYTIDSHISYSVDLPKCTQLTLFQWS